MIRRLFLVLTLSVGMFMYFAPEPEAQAFVDPVTIAILAPIAIKAAQVLAPYVLRMIRNTAAGLVKVGAAMLGIFRLPLGLFQCTLFCWIPGSFKNGIKNLGYGVVAPFKMGFRVLILPLNMFGVGI